MCVGHGPGQMSLFPLTDFDRSLLSQPSNNAVCLFIVEWLTGKDGDDLDLR